MLKIPVSEKLQTLSYLIGDHAYYPTSRFALGRAMEQTGFADEGVSFLHYRSRDVDSRKNIIQMIDILKKVDLIPPDAPFDAEHFRAMENEGKLTVGTMNITLRENDIRVTFMPPTEFTHEEILDKLQQAIASFKEVKEEHPASLVPTYDPKKVQTSGGTNANDRSHPSWTEDLHNAAIDKIVGYLIEKFKKTVPNCKVTSVQSYRLSNKLSYENTAINIHFAPTSPVSLTVLQNATREIISVLGNATFYHNKGTPENPEFHLEVSGNVRELASRIQGGMSRDKDNA